MSVVDTVKIMAMGIIIALLGVLAVNGSSRTTAADAASAGKIIAVTDSAKNMISLFLIDTDLKCIAVYTCDDTAFGFSSARYYGYDLGIKEVEKFSRKGYTIKEAEKMYKESVTTK